MKPNDGIPQINVILKGDVAGSVEAILDVFDTYGSNDKCQLSVVHYGVGNITATDLQLAETFNGKKIPEYQYIIFYVNIM